MPVERHKWIASFAGLCIVSVVAAAVALRPDRILSVGAGLAAHEVCSATFVTGVDADRFVPEQLAALMGRPSALIRYSVDTGARTASASFLGLLATRTARFDPGYGCRLDYADNIPLAPVEDQPIRSPVALQGVETASTELLASIDRVFAERPATTTKAVKAVVVMVDGRVVAERYASGIDASTPLPSWSIAKSLVNAISGVLARQHRLNLSEQVDAPEWRMPNDPRRAITVEQALRMTSGLDANEDGKPTDPVARMEFTQADMAHFAAQRPLKASPGRIWEYTSANTLILARMLGQRVGGGATGMREFVGREIAGPLGIKSLTMEVDGAGTFVGSSFAYMTARDYAKFGELYRNGGIAPDGRRILPEDWVAWSRRSTLGSSYGAGFLDERRRQPVCPSSHQRRLSPRWLLCERGFGPTNLHRAVGTPRGGTVG